MTVAALPDGPLPAGPWLEPPLFSDGTEQPVVPHYAARLSLPRPGSRRHEVLRNIVRAGAAGLTDEEMQDELGMRANTQRPRRVELCNEGWIEDSGQRRPTVTGKPSIAWRLSQRGHDRWVA